MKTALLSGFYISGFLSYIFLTGLIVALPFWILWLIILGPIKIWVFWIVGAILTSKVLGVFLHYVCHPKDLVSSVRHIVYHDK
jgi:hypothetical protein